MLAAAPLAAAAVEPVWPPTGEAATRLQQLRGVLISASSTPAQRRAAREEMMRMIVNDAAPARPAAMPPRAAVESPRSAPGFGPALAKPLPVPPDVSAVAPPALPGAPVVSPANGAMLLPLGRSLVDPATGRIYLDMPGGYIDPATGQILPKR